MKSTENVVSTGDTHEPPRVDRNLNRSTAIKTNNYAANAYEIHAVPALISYLHACAGFIPKETWLWRIDAGFYMGWASLTSERVQKYLPKSEITMLGHLKMVRKGIRPTLGKLRSKIHDIGVGIIDTANIQNDVKNLIAFNLPERFPIVSGSGNKYIFVMYDWDSDYIKPVTMQSRETSEMIRCYGECYEHYKAAGFTARLLRLDNEVSRKLIKRINDNKLDYQLASPSDHRRNPAE